MNLDTLMQLAEIENIVGIKDSSKDITWFYNAVITVRERRDDFAFFGGSDALIYTHLSLGGNGVVSAVANAFPEIVIELYEEFKKGNYESAKKVQDKVLRIRQALKNGPYMAGVKGALKLRGMDFLEPRSPLQSLDEEELKRLEEDLRKIGVL
jgi:4-hydroxy-tetrahydrodipicolinate synthase/2-dehydro-3-deoxy-phosphogluconate/2-dehydro-3-deoxy-6-phosphogalactonate aldolase